MKYQKKRSAIILLADGTIFHGKSVGDKEGTAFGGVQDKVEKVIDLILEE